MKLRGRSSLFLPFFFLMFAVIFGGVGIGVLSGLMSDGDESGLFGIPFLLVGVGTGTASAVMFVRMIKARRTARLGISGVGHYLESRVGYYMNNVPMYNIRFAFVDAHGHTHEVKTPSNYRRRDADELEKMKEFPIKFRGKHAVIMRDYNFVPQARAGQQEPRVEGVRCEYCGLRNHPEDKRCSACGARVK
jgi:hypothetical protein